MIILYNKHVQALFIKCHINTLSFWTSFRVIKKSSYWYILYSTCSLNYVFEHCKNSSAQNCPSKRIDKKTPLRSLGFNKTIDFLPSYQPKVVLHNKSKDIFDLNKAIRKCLKKIIITFIILFKTSKRVGWFIKKKKR